MKRALWATLIGLAIVAGGLPAAEASYESGVQAYERGDYAQALKDWLVEAEKGNANAQHNVAVIYDEGRGVPPDPAEAKKWYERAAAQGVPEAQNNLGMLYSRGRGTELDQARAIELWTAAARRGYPFAEYNLGLAYANGQGVPKDYDRARELFQSAAARNMPDAQFALGQVYYHGFGVEQDLEEARRWFELAATRKPDARRMLARLDQELAIASDATPEPGTQPEPQVQAAAAPQPQQPATSSPAPPPGAGSAASDQDAGTLASAGPVAPKQEAASAPTPIEEQGSQPGAAAGSSEVEGIRLWLGSLPSPDKAAEQWSRMQRSFSDLLRPLEMDVAEVERDNRKFYRLLAGPLPDRERGREICRLLQERDPQTWCKVVGTP